MPKQKSNRAAAKRFKLSGTGKPVRAHSGLRHGMIGKGRNRRRRLVGTVTVAQPDVARVLRLLGKR
jgi:large subunit ribosomal protein L35